MSNTPAIDKEKALAQCDLLSPLAGPILKDLGSIGITRRYAGGDRIFSSGDSGASMMAIAQGSVRISAPAPTARDVVLADLSVGDVFGEIALLDGDARSADAVALTNCTIIVLERRAFLDAMRRHPEIAELMIKMLCARIRRADERMMDIGFLSLSSRLAKALIHATQARAGSTGSPARKLSLSQSELADLVGSSRENVNRCLRRWQKGGLIDLKEGWIVIEDRSRLESQSR